MTISARFLFLLGFFSFTAHTEEVEIPHRVSSTAFCEAVLNRMEVHSLEKNPDETHEQLATNFLASFKTELGIYQIKADRRLRNKSISSAAAKQVDRALLASRIDGILSDGEASHKAYLRLTGRDKIESFFGEVLQRERLLAQHLRLRDSSYLRLGNSLYRLGMAEVFFEILTDFKLTITKIALGYVAARLFAEKVEGRRLSHRFNDELMLPLAEFKSGWHYSSARFSVNKDLKCPTLGNLPPEDAAQLIYCDHRNYLDSVMGAIFTNSPDKWTGYRRHVAIDQFYRWDDLTQEPELVIVFRHYKEKPKNPKPQSQKQSEKSLLLDALPSCSG